MKKIYIKFVRHKGKPGEYVYAFKGARDFRDWYDTNYAFKTGNFLPANANIDDICMALRNDFNCVSRVPARDARKYKIY